MQVNPKGKRRGLFRVVRGVGWDGFLDGYSAIRFRNGPSREYSYVGFRVVFGVKHNASQS